ncbi:MAG: T9SS type A sorting domain-containing protein [Bacteroidales bacterium]|nr:T9SS type A sorting domain-containing protein [Bacteroidales bacterium]
MNGKIKLVAAILFCTLAFTSKAQVLNVVELTQEQNQWCWAGVSACALDYYGATTGQCVVAEYTRTVATWHNFGLVDCCIDATQGCNYWNYNWGYAGSIQDILVHFASITNNGVDSALSKAVVTNEVTSNRPFIIRWGWTTGGGHFLVGHGLVGDNLYYMNPWYGEGLKIATYSWVVSAPDHTWTHTNQLVTSSPRPYPAQSVTGPQSLVKNQMDVPYTTPVIPNATSYLWVVTPATAGTINSTSREAVLNLTPEFLGTFSITVKGINSIGEGNTSNPLVVTVSPAAGITDPAWINRLSVFPNPSTGKISFGPVITTLPVFIQLTDLTGVEHFSQPLPASGELDLSTLPKGMYLLKLRSGDFSQTTKLILQ